MTALPFNNSIPASANNPANDQPLMLINNQSEFTIWTRDHVGYTSNGSGRHLQVTFNQTTTQAPPADPLSILYTILEPSTSKPQMQFFNSQTSGQYSSAQVGAGYDSTCSTMLLNGIIAKFGHITPGINSGTVSFTNAGGNVNLNIGAFPNNIFALFGQVDDTSVQPNTFVYLKSPLTSQFQFKGVVRTSSPSSAVANFWFLALGN